MRNICNRSRTGTGEDGSGGTSAGTLVMAAAKNLLLELLSEGDEVPSEEIFTRAKELGIGMRTVNAAKKNIPEIKSRRNRNRWCWRMKA